MKNFKNILNNESLYKMYFFLGLQSRISDLEKNIGNKDHNFGKTFV